MPNEKTHPAMLYTIRTKSAPVDLVRFARCAHWGRVGVSGPTETITGAIVHGVEITEQDGEGRHTGHRTFSSAEHLVRTGIQNMIDAGNYWQILGRLFNGTESGADCDVLVQFAAFNEERYC